jgi:hypothetical protein
MYPKYLFSGAISLPVQLPIARMGTPATSASPDCAGQMVSSPCAFRPLIFAAGAFGGVRRQSRPAGMRGRSVAGMKRGPAAMYGKNIQAAARANY